MNTETLEEVGGRGEQQVVAHRFRIRARRDARLQIVLLDPVRQPLEVAVAEERVVAQTAATSHALVQNTKLCTRKALLYIIRKRIE